MPIDSYHAICTRHRGESKTVSNKDVEGKKTNDNELSEDLVNPGAYILTNLFHTTYIIYISLIQVYLFLSFICYQISTITCHCGENKQPTPISNTSFECITHP
jgi:hypothetical protein